MKMIRSMCGCALAILLAATAASAQDPAAPPAAVSPNAAFEVASVKPSNPTPDPKRSLLADRFKLKTHTETRELPVYDLVIARSDGRLGPELKPSQADCSKADGAEQVAALANGDVSSFVGKPRPCSVSTDPSGGPLNLMMRGDGQEIKALVETLTVFTGRAVRDKTGLTHRYDFAMKLELQMVLTLAQKAGANIPAGAAANIPQSDGSSLMTTLNEQLGLKLESTKDNVTSSSSTAWRR